jgi:hypothetical protein
MDEKDGKNNISNEETCEMQSFRCTANYLLLGIVVFFLLLFAVTTIIK